jgi:hypothetical protein
MNSEFLEPDEEEHAKGEEAALDLVAHMKRMKVARNEFHIRDGNGVWVVKISFESTGKRPN